MRLRTHVTPGLLGTLMLMGIACSEPPPNDGANVRVIIQNLGSVPHVVEVMLNVPEWGVQVDAVANARINGVGQAEVHLYFYVDGVLQDLDIPQITVSEADSSCIGCPENTEGSGSYTWPSMTPGDYEATIPIYWAGVPNASIDVSLTFESSPGAEWAYLMPAEQTVSYPITVLVKPTNAEGPLSDLVLTVEFDAASQVDLLDEEGDGVYYNKDPLLAPGPAGDHLMTITLTNTATTAVTEITHTYTTVTP